MNLIVRLAVVLGIVGAPVFGQLDASILRSKFGPPLDRETFVVRPGIQMVVDYGPGKRVCRIQLPSGNHFETRGYFPATKAKVYTVLDALVPLSIRGKEVSRKLFQTEYEHVTITDLDNGSMRDGITVTFKEPECPVRAPKTAFSFHR
jgi:hypothetical protein